MEILIIRYSSLGDILIATPIIRAIKGHYRSANLDILVDERYSPLLYNNPHIKNVITFKRDSNRVSEMIRLRRSMKRYDIVFDLQNKPFSKTISRILSRGEVFTFNKQSCDRYNNKEKRHILELYSSFLANCGIELTDYRYELCYKREIEDRRVGINIEGGHLSKRLSKRQLIEVSRKLSNEGFRIYLIGTEASSELARDIMSCTPNTVDATSYNVQELIETIFSLSLLITPDSGPLHIAAAAGVRTVAVFGSTSPYRWLPPVKDISLIYTEYFCSPCSEYGTSLCRAMKGFSCIRGISPDIIVLEAKRLYERQDS